MKKYELRDKSDKLLKSSLSHKKIEAAAFNADCETRVVMVMIQK